jgi:amino acid adenylation domain-containing protein
MMRLQELFGRSAQARPESPAVVDRGAVTAYGPLELATNQLARALREAGIAKGDRIALLASKSTAAITGALAAYKTDGILVPLDPAGPASRVARILRSCGCRFLVAGGATIELLCELESMGALRDVPVAWTGGRKDVAGRLAVEFTLEDLRSLPATSLHYRSRSSDPAHILYTSGSTGEPKGVVITHENVVHFVDWALKRYGFGPSDRFSGHSPLHFDLSTFDLFGAFGAGAALYLLPPELNLQARELARFIRESELTEWLSVPSALNFMAQNGAIRQNDFPALRRLFWCGEVFPTPALIHCMKRLPHVKFTNWYGPTEATIASSYYDVPECPQDPKESIPIGSACDGEELVLADEKLKPVPPGAIGDLYIRGVGLSPGYWNDEERTRAAFLNGSGAASRMYKTGDLARIDDRGRFHIVGRADSQIKSRGYRIELGEIESAVCTLGLTREAVVTAIATDGFEGTLICCAFVPRSGEVNASVLGRRLRALLPFYMLPVRWMAMDRLPRNGSGKVDRRAIKESFAGHQTIEARRHAAQ